MSEVIVKHYILPDGTIYNVSETLYTNTESKDEHIKAQIQALDLEKNDCLLWHDIENPQKIALVRVINPDIPEYQEIWMTAQADWNATEKSLIINNSGEEIEVLNLEYIKNKPAIINALANPLDTTHNTVNAAEKEALKGTLGTPNINNKFITNDDLQLFFTGEVNRDQNQKSFIVSSSITTDKIADTAISTSKIIDSSITTDKIANNAVTENKILNASITSDKIQSNAVKTTHINNAAVTTDKIADNTITTAKLTQQSITKEKIASNAVSNSEMQVMEANTIKGNNTNSQANPTDLTAVQVRAILNVETINENQVKLDKKLDKNTNVVGATKTKITFDEKGLVTAASDLIPTDIPAGIDAVKIADGSINNTTFQYLGGLTDNIQSQLNDKASNVDLTNLKSQIQGLDWQESVLNFCDPSSSLPINPAEGDRYISTATANGWGEDQICEYKNNVWEKITVDKGTAVFIENENILYTYNGSDWIKFGGLAGHNQINGIQGGISNEYYHLTSGQISIVENMTELINSKGLNDLTTAEINQLKNIDSNSIDNTKWSYLSNLNQNLSTSSNPLFNNLTVTNSLKANGLSINQIIETDSTKNFISTAKNTAYNKNFGINEGEVAQGNHNHTLAALSEKNYDSLTNRPINASIENSGFMSAIDKQKLDGIEEKATADMTKEEIKQLYEENQQTNAFDDTFKSKLEGIASGAQVNVKSDWNAATGDAQILNKPVNATQSIAGFMSVADKQKLDDIENNATADMTAAEIKIEYEKNLDTNAFNDEFKTKLEGIEVKAQVNVKSDWNATTGDAQILNKPINATSTLAGFMSSNDKQKLDEIENNATADMTAAEIKTEYEKNLDTNAFNDTFKSKLEGIAVGATANDTDANLKNRVNHTGTQLSSTISDFNTAVTNNENVVVNTAKVSADGSVTTHNDVTSAGSGQIITTNERSKLTAITNTGSGQIITTNERSKLTAITNTGSGEIITGDERLKLAGIADGANKYEITVDLINGLTSTATDKALTAMQGNVLNATITNVNNNLLALANSDGNSDKVDWSQIKNVPNFGSENWLAPIPNKASLAELTAKINDCVLVQDDDDGKAAQYIYNGTNWIKIADVDWTPLSATDIKNLYESNIQTNAFTDDLKSKLEGVAAGSQVNVKSDWNATTGDAEILNKPGAASQINAGLMSATDKQKIDGIAVGATANDTDVNLKNRTNHTGTQLSITISDFNTAVADNAAVVANTAKISANGSVTTHSDITSAGSGQIITSAERTKLVGIEDGANKYLITTDLIDNLTTTATNKALTAKQGNILNNNFLALANTGGNNDKVDWSQLQNVPNFQLESDPLTATEIKTSYESNLDTNAFTDTLKSKLNNIADGAEVNVQSNWTQTVTTADDYIKNKPTIPSKLSDLTDDKTYENTNNKNQPNGYAGLDSNSKISPDQLPPLAITSTNVVTNTTARDALTVQEGDVAVVTNENKTYIFDSTSTWQELKNPTGLALGTGASNAYYGDKGETAYQHSLNVAKHREINDSGIATTDLWSASKIKTTFDTKQNFIGTGTAGQILATNDAASGVEWIDSPNVGTGAAGQILATNDAASGVEWIDSPVGGLKIANEATAATTAVDGYLYPVNVTSAAVTITPPTAPIAGMRFGVSDSRSNASLNNITIALAAQKLHASANDYIIDINMGYIEFLYVNTTIGWIIKK